MTWIAANELVERLAQPGVQRLYGLVGDKPKHLPRISSLKRTEVRSSSQTPGLRNPCGETWTIVVGRQRRERSCEDEDHVSG
jgi:hypothetical protein